ncbi:hypothetical protein ACRAWD_20070 [Caulobacter segnis]
MTSLRAAGGRPAGRLGLRRCAKYLGGSRDQHRRRRRSAWMRGTGLLTRVGADHMGRLCQGGWSARASTSLACCPIGAGGSPGDPGHSATG